MDLAILQWIQDNLRCGILDTIMPAVTALGSGSVLWLALAAVLLLRPQTRRTGWMLLGALALETVCCNLLLKPLVARPRPFALEPGIQLLIAPPGDFSFPSGHTAAGFAAVSALYFGKSRLWLPALAAAVLIAFSRLYLYVHYPTDVLAGAVLGVACGWAVRAAAERMRRPAG